MNKEQFELRVEKIPIAGCWLWEFSKGGNEKGYAKTWYEGKPMGAHRASYMIYKGLIPEEIGVLHRCDIKCCVNPEHLYLGDQRVNLKDSVDRGRNVNASRTHCSRGHEFTSENTRYEGRSRRCIACKKSYNSFYLTFGALK